MTAVDWDISLAEIQLQKEYQRAAGPAAANRSTFNQLGGSEITRFKFPPCPKCGAASGGNGTKKHVRYAKCKNKKCGNTFIVTKTSS